MSKKAAFLTLIFVCFMVTPGWFANQNDARSVQQEIEELIQQKEMAINKKNEEQYLNGINPSLSFYVREQKRWFQDAVQWIDPGSYRLRLISIIPDKEHQIRAWVEQSYTRKGQKISVCFPILFQETEKGWKDSDLPFYTLTRGNIVIRYSTTDLKEQASIGMEAAHKAVQELKRKMDWSPAHPIEVKFYHKPEWFRQSVKLSLPSWVGGWHESGESVKLVGAEEFSDKQLISSGIVHEVTHMMVSDMTGDNAAYWLQEGAAEYFQSHLLPGLHTREERTSSPHWKFAHLEQLNLERLNEREAVAYYNQCYQFFRYLMETYGEEKINRLFSVLELHPQDFRTISDKQKQTNNRTRKALQKVLGKSLEHLEQDWLQSNQQRDDPPK